MRSKACAGQWWCMKWKVWLTSIDPRRAGRSHVCVAGAVHLGRIEERVCDVVPPYVS